MIRSMTGFGRADFEVEGAHFVVEIRSVNHRFLDVNVRLPRGLARCEPDVRARIQASVSRGKVDVSVMAPPGGGLPAELSIDVAAAGEYLAAAERLRAEHGVAGTLEVAQLLSLPGVACTIEHELPAERLQETLLEAVDDAAKAMNAMRGVEGSALERELEARLAGVAERAAAIEVDAGSVQEAVRARLRKRTEQLRQETGVLDEARLHQEIVLAADRMDIREEVVRLCSHVDQFRTLLAEGRTGKAIGRRLDFLLQEMGREANTVGAKGSSAAIAHHVVELKAEIERLREQVQNVE